MQKFLIGLAIVSVVLGANGWAIAQEGALDKATRATEDNALRTEREALLRELREERTELQTNLQTDRRAFQREATTLLRDLKNATPQERQAAIQDLRERREEFLRNAQELRKNLRESAQERREAFHEKVRDARDRARISAAHGKGLRMVNRFRAAIARFEHLTDRMETRADKMEARGISISSVTPLIEEARNMQAGAEARMEELKAKYEAFLDGERVGGISDEARAIAQTLKKEIEDLHAQLKEIASALRASQPAEEVNGAES